MIINLFIKIKKNFFTEMYLKNIDDFLMPNNYVIVNTSIQLYYLFF